MTNTQFHHDFKYLFVILILKSEKKKVLKRREEGIIYAQFDHRIYMCYVHLSFYSKLMWQFDKIFQMVVAVVVNDAFKHGNQ